MSGRIGSSGNWMVRAATVAAVLVAAGWWAGGRLQAADGDGSKVRPAEGRELFEREWLPGDSRAHGGDGLGPVYNDSSCIACHNLGGTGGAGPASKNVDIVTASPNTNMMVQTAAGSNARKPGFLGRALGSLVGLDDSDAAKKGGRNPARPRVDTSELVKAHPGFRTTRSVVLHRYGVEAEYELWRLKMTGSNRNFMPSGDTTTPRSMSTAQTELNLNAGANAQSNIGPFTLVGSQRNPSPLFGTGLIDAIPDQVLEEAAIANHPGFGEVRGRVSRLKDGRIGRFGWKAQTPSLHDFVLTACAVELGLEVPGHHQGGVPQNPEARAKGLDLNASECEALEKYVRDISRPSERRPGTSAEARDLDAGRALFGSVGCATCHVPRLGRVEGIYSDMLLHDMGQALGDTGQYSVFDPSASEEEFVNPETSPDAPPAEASNPGDEAAVLALAQPNNCPVPSLKTAGKRPNTGMASRFEWRTPPLWGFRDSGPYLHDGRAENLDQAVSQHGGESQQIAVKYFRLSQKERRQIEAFLKSLTAPVAGDAGRVAAAR